MKNNIVKMTAAAALVLGMVSAAHAASQAKIEFEGKIVHTACDVTLDDVNDSNIQLGAFAGDEFVNITDTHSVRTAPIKLDLGSSCKGAAIPKGSSINLVADQQGSIPAALKAADLFGDTDLGVGVDLKGATWKGGPVPADTQYTAITPSAGLVLYTNNADAPVAPDAVTLPTAVFLKAGLRAHVAPAAITGGSVHSNITFTAAYE